MFHIFLEPTVLRLFTNIILSRYICVFFLLLFFTLIRHWRKIKSILQVIKNKQSQGDLRIKAKSFIQDTENKQLRLDLRIKVKYIILGGVIVGGSRTIVSFFFWSVYSRGNLEDIKYPSTIIEAQEVGIGEVWTDTESRNGPLAFEQLMEKEEINMIQVLLGFLSVYMHLLISLGGIVLTISFGNKSILSFSYFIFIFSGLIGFLGLWLQLYISYTMPFYG